MTSGPFDADDRTLDGAVRAAAQAAREGLSDHPTPDQLADYSLGVHAPEDEDLIQEHLTLCGECAELVLGLGGLAAAPSDGEEEEASRPLRFDAARKTGAAPRPTGGGVLRWALAASLVVGAGLLLWGGWLRSELAAARAPSADVVVADLVPVGSTAVQRGGTVPRVEVPAGADRLVLLLNLGEVTSSPRHRIELAGPDGEVVWRAEDVRPDDLGAFVVDLLAATLAPGAYELRLFGVGEGGEAPLAVYRFELTAAR